MRRLTSLLLIISIVLSCLCISGCNRTEEEFPNLVFADSEAEMTSVDNEDRSASTGDFHELTVALPLSEHTVDLLMKLYYAKNNGLFPQEMTGADIGIEYLEAINTPWVVNTITTTTTGETASIIESLIAEESAPDLFLAWNIDDMISYDLIIPFDEYLSDRGNISSYSIYLNALDTLRTGDQHYGLPFYSTVYLLAGSREYLPESGVPAFNISKEDLLEYIRSIPPMNSEGTSYITRFYDASELIPFMGEEFAGSISDGGLSSTVDSFGADPRVSRLCGMWLMNSGEITTWETYYPDGLYFTMLPSDNVNAVVYPVCLSSSCTDPEFAAEFASFICFDSDAQMLLRRLEPLRGFFPPVTSRGVWNEIFDDPVFGSQAMLYEQYIADADFTVAED